MAEAKMTIDEMIVALRPVANQAKAALALAQLLNDAYDASSVLSKADAEKRRIEDETEKAKKALEVWAAKERGAADTYEKAAVARKEALDFLNKEYNDRVAEINKATRDAYEEFRHLKAQEQEALHAAQARTAAELARADLELAEKRAAMDAALAEKQQVVDALKKEIDRLRARLSNILA